MSWSLRIFSPEKVEVVGTVDRGVVPGATGDFRILPQHPPIISTLNSGRIAFFDSEGEHEVKAMGGFVEVQKNSVNVCVEL